jgi:hypothetical protein
MTLCHYGTKSKHGETMKEVFWGDRLCGRKWESWLERTRLHWTGVEPSLRCSIQKGPKFFGFFGKELFWKKRGEFSHHKIKARQRNATAGLFIFLTTVLPHRDPVGF